MRSLKEITDKIKQPVTGACFLIMGLSFAVQLGLDGTNVNKPQFPEPSIGRTIAHPIKRVGDVYLTQEEDEPYQWLWAIAIASGAVIVLLHATSYILSRRKNDR